MQTSRLRFLVAVYNASANAKGRIPANEQEIKDFIAERDNADIKPLNLDSVDDLFISERDGEPFVVFYGKLPDGVDKEVAACESKGADGTRWLGFRLGNVMEVNEQEFRKYVPVDVVP